MLRQLLNKFFRIRKNYTRINMNPVRGFWQKVIDEKLSVGETIAVVAPMADVTDAPFRQMIAKYSRMGKPGGGPDVLWTEFVSATGLCSPGRDILKRDLAFSDNERPIVAQLFTGNPDHMREAAKLCRELGFDGIDINMGCPDKSIEKQGSGAGHIKDWRTAQQVIKAAQEGAGPLPVSVKTRLGYNRVEFMEWLPKLLECNIPVLTVHLRTRKEMSKVDAHWEYMKDIVLLVRQMTGPLEEGGTIILGNGDIKSLEEGEEKAKASGANGVMVGRGIFGTPWFFDKEISKEGKSVEEKLSILIEHAELYETMLGDIKNFAIMKKHFKAYVNGFDGAKELRVELMECNTSKEVRAVIERFLGNKSAQ